MKGLCRISNHLHPQNPPTLNIVISFSCFFFGPVVTLSPRIHNTGLPLLHGGDSSWQEMILSVVINSLLYSHLAPLSVSPSNCSLMPRLTSICASWTPYFLRCGSSQEAEPRTVWSAPGVRVILWEIINMEGLGGVGGVHVCSDYVEFFVCLFRPLCFRAVYCVIQWVRNEACRMLETMLEGVFVVLVSIKWECGSESVTERDEKSSSLWINSWKGEVAWLCFCHVSHHVS